MKSYVVTIQMKATEQYFPVVVTPSVTDPVKSISSLGSRRKGHWADLFFTWFFRFSCVLLIKAERGGRPYILSGMKTLHIFNILL